MNKMWIKVESIFQVNIFLKIKMKMLQDKTQVNKWMKATIWVWGDTRSSLEIGSIIPMGLWIWDRITVKIQIVAILQFVVTLIKRSSCVNDFPFFPDIKYNKLLKNY
jgi:hypothetical protein